MAARGCWPGLHYPMEPYRYSGAGHTRPVMCSIIFAWQSKRRLRLICTKSVMLQGYEKLSACFDGLCSNGVSSIPRQWNAYRRILRICAASLRYRIVLCGVTLEPPTPLSDGLWKSDAEQDQWVYFQIEPVWREYYMQSLPMK